MNFIRSGHWFKPFLLPIIKINTNLSWPLLNSSPDPGLDTSGFILVRSSMGSMVNRVVPLYKKAPLVSVRFELLRGGVTKKKVKIWEKFPKGRGG